MLKKLTLAVIGLAVSGAASAGMYSTPPAPSCTPGDVTVPCELDQWNLGVRALYLKPLYSNEAGYRNVFRSSTLSVPRDIDSDWGWGYRLEGSYHFSTGSDITMDWTHYDTEDNHFGYVGTVVLPGIGASNQLYRLFIENKFDQVNLVMGQHVDMGLLKDARFYGGMQYANIRVNATNYYVGLPTAIATATSGVRDPSYTDFNGVGPTFGIDYAYEVTPGLSITANTATSILYGTTRLNRSTVFGNGLVLRNNYASRKAIVPSFEAKLGANYAYPMALGVLNLEGGYQAVNYFHPLQSIQEPGFDSPLRTIVNTNFGLYGPYLGLKWVGNA